MMDISDILKHWLLWLIIAAGGAVWGWLYYIKTKKGREFWDAKRIKLPIFGPIAHKICLARFTRTLASLVRSGVPILEVLQIVSQTVGNALWKKPSRPPPPTSNAAKAFQPRWPSIPFFPA